MEIQRLRCFLALSEFLSFTLAADSLHISQSSMSKHIMHLEQDLGVLLFERKGRATQLTEAALSLLKYAESVVAVYDEMMQTVAGFSDTEARITKLGIPPMGSQNMILKKLKAITDSNPKGILKIVEREELELINDVMHGIVDMVVIRKEILPSNGFRAYTIFSEGAVVMLPENHPLGDADSLDFAAIKDENFIFFDEMTAPHKIFLEAIRNAGFEPNIVRTVKTETVRINCVRESEGICLLFENDTELLHYIPGIKLIPLNEEVRSEIVLAAPNWRKITPAERIISSGLKNWSTGD